MSEYITTVDAAALLCTHPSVLRHARATGLLYERPAPTFYRVGKRKVVYRKDDLKAFIASGQAVAESNPQTTAEKIGGEK